MNPKWEVDVKLHLWKTRFLRWLDRLSADPKSHATVFVLLLTYGTANTPICSSLPTPVDYSPRSVPGEAGISFSRVTENEPERFDSWMDMAQDYFETPRQNFSITRYGIAYVAAKEFEFNVYIRDLEGESVARQRTFSGKVRGVAASSDGKYIAYIEERTDSWNIYTTTWDSGSTPIQINELGTSASFPVFSPDNSKIMYRGSHGDGYGICTLDVATGIRAFHGEGLGVSFTPDGRRVAAIRERADTDAHEIWLVNLENGDESLLLSSNYRSYRDCAVSPDGKTLAVVSTYADENTRPNLDIFFANLDGTGLRQITFHPGEDLSPRWSPDGRSLYIVSDRKTGPGGYNIWRMDFK